MIKILITGANSYIGKNVECWLSQFENQYTIDTLDMLDENWKNYNFRNYDVVFHVAGIAHRKETKDNAELYYRVNERLAIDVAQRAKEQGVKQFIILSSMSVYGLTVGHITKQTVPKPNSNYGKSKYNADKKILDMSCDSFKVAILRPPMVYGKGCKGNYQSLRSVAIKSPIFVDYHNERSMIYVGNLAAFVKEVIEGDKYGVFFPQDAEYVSTSDMVRKIAESNGKKIHYVSLMNWAIRLMLRMPINVVKKVFGTLTYEKVDLVSLYDFDDAMKETE